MQTHKHTHIRVHTHTEEETHITDRCCWSEFSEIAWMDLICTSGKLYCIQIPMCLIYSVKYKMMWKAVWICPSVCSFLSLTFPWSHSFFFFVSFSERPIPSPSSETLSEVSRELCEVRAGCWQMYGMQKRLQVIPDEGQTNTVIILSYQKACFFCCRCHNYVSEIKLAWPLLRTVSGLTCFILNWISAYKNKSSLNLAFFFYLQLYVVTEGIRSQIQVSKVFCALYKVGSW